MAIRSSVVDELARSFPRGVHVDRAPDTPLSGYLPADFDSYFLLSGGCSCDLFRELTSEDSVTEEREERRRKYEAKGWSEAKIERALRGVGGAPKGWTGLRPDLREALVRIIDAYGTVYVFAHWYEGDVGTEHVAVTAERSIGVGELAHLDDQRTDELLKIQRFA